MVGRQGDGNVEWSWNYSSQENKILTKGKLNIDWNELNSLGNGLKCTLTYLGPPTGLVILSSCTKLTMDTLAGWGFWTFTFSSCFRWGWWLVAVNAEVIISPCNVAGVFVFCSLFLYHTHCLSSNVLLLCRSGVYGRDERRTRPLEFRVFKNQRN